MVKKNKSKINDVEPKSFIKQLPKELSPDIINNNIIHLCNMYLSLPKNLCFNQQYSILKQNYDLYHNNINLWNSGDFFDSHFFPSQLNLLSNLLLKLDLKYMSIIIFKQTLSRFNKIKSHIDGKYKEIIYDDFIENINSFVRAINNELNIFCSSTNVKRIDYISNILMSDEEMGKFILNILKKYFDY